MSNVKFHSSKDSTWINAAGDVVPLKFVPKTDKAKETLAAKIHKSAINLESQIYSFYCLMNAAFTEVDQMVKEEYAIKNGKNKKAGKGSVTWYNFDKSFKIEADINEIVKWDGPLMTEALRLINEYLDSTLSDAKEFVKQLVSDALANSKGMIDSRKIFQLLKHEPKIKNIKYSKACELMKQGQSIDKTKLYMRAWERAADGSYRNINLNFSTL